MESFERRDFLCQVSYARLAGGDDHEGTNFNVRAGQIRMRTLRASACPGLVTPIGTVAEVVVNLRIGPEK